MELRILSTPLKDAAADWLVVPLLEAAESGAALDDATGGLLSRLREAGDLTGSLAEIVPVRGVTGIAARRLLFVGLGKPQDLTTARVDKALMAAARHVSDKKETAVAVAVPDLPDVPGSPLANDDAARAIAAAFTVGCVGQGVYRTEPGRFPFRSLTILTGKAAGKRLQAAVERGRILGESVNLTRELVNRGPQEIFPESFADRARQVAGDLGLDCDVLDESRLRSERMGALLAVAQGSVMPPRLVAIDYRGVGNGKPVLALCGKGVTFDSGGLSIKNTENMLTMKCDMAGAATVLGALSAIARLKLPVNVTGYMGLVENMPGGGAFKVGDVLTARNGVTIEVQNTDAEGRLVLADVLSYAADRGADRLIDLATLTGACVVALGEDVTGAFANHDIWLESVLSAAKSAGEDVWPLPMFDLYAELIKSDVADIRNVGGRWGGAITAAKFLERFVADKPWVHLDIAGPSFAASNKPHREGGGTGAMVRTLVELAERFGASL